jgi:hypothetical protein
MIKEYYTHFINFISDGYNIGVFIGLLIILFLIRFIHFGTRQIQLFNATVVH